MSKKWKIAASLMIAVLVVAVVGTSLAFADEPTPEPSLPTPPYGPGWRAGRGQGHGPMMGRGWSWGRKGVAMLDVAAEALDMTTEELTAELRAGKTLLEVAEEKGIELQELTDAFLAARQEVLQKAVEEGYLTQERADRMLQHMAEEVEECLEEGGGLGRGCGLCGSRFNSPSGFREGARGARDRGWGRRSRGW